jgi:hypothetical protein
MRFFSKRRIILVGGAILILVIIIVGMWFVETLGPMPEALLAMESDEEVLVETEKWLSFIPKTVNVTKGLIFYPGGKVAPESYAPMAREIAKNGFLVIITPMFLNLAVFEPSKATEVIKFYSQIDSWSIGGHSLGGSMAAQYVSGNKNVTKLILMASYPPESVNLSDFKNLKVLSIYGTNDGILNQGLFNKTQKLLPNDTIFLSIIGGNHAQFGYYGSQPGDKLAEIGRSQQQEMILNATLTFLHS